MRLNRQSRRISSGGKRQVPLRYSVSWRRPKAEGRLKLLAAQGESVPGPILEIGNTNSCYQFRIGARNCVKDWNMHDPAHHCTVGIGHIAQKLEKLDKLLGLETVVVS